jgi:hypothetical protein
MAWQWLHPLLLRLSVVSLLNVWFDVVCPEPVLANRTSITGFHAHRSAQQKLTLI